MLPDFPELKKKLSLLLRERLRQSFARQAPVISDIRRFKSHEGDTFTIHRLDGSVTTSTYHLTETEFSIERHELPTLTPQQLIAKIDEAAGKMAEQASEHFFKELSEAVTRVGNVVNAQGQPISPELVFQVLEKIELDFDEHGKPHGLTMVVGTKVAEALRTLIPKWEADTELNTRYQDLMKKKREEWRDRESRRKLVD
jgi:hypothetical protein